MRAKETFDLEARLDLGDEVARHEHSNVIVGVGQQRLPAEEHANSIDAEKKVRRRHDHRATRPQHSLAFEEKALGVDEVLDDFCGDHDVELLSRKREGLTEVMSLDVVGSLRIQLEAGNIPTAPAQVFQVAPTRAAELKHSPDRERRDHPINLSVERVICKGNLVLRPISLIQAGGVRNLFMSHRETIAAVGPVARRGRTPSSLPTCRSIMLHLGVNPERRDCFVIGGGLRRSA